MQKEIIISDTLKLMFSGLKWFKHEAGKEPIVVLKVWGLDVNAPFWKLVKEFKWQISCQRRSEQFFVEIGVEAIDSLGQSPGRQSGQDGSFVVGGEQVDLRSREGSFRWIPLPRMLLCMPP